MKHTEQENPLRTQAARLYPDNHYLQAEWLRAVAVVRTTAQGWKLEHHVPKLRQSIGRPQ